jgi:hypothetical protein
MLGLQMLITQERLFLSYPQAPKISENRVVPISLKGGTFYISPEEAKRHANYAHLFYYMFITSILFIGVMIKLGAPARANIFFLNRHPN